MVVLFPAATMLVLVHCHKSMTLLHHQFLVIFLYFKHFVDNKTFLIFQNISENEAWWDSLVKVLAPCSATRGSSLQGGGILGREGASRTGRLVYRPVPSRPRHIWAGTNDHCEDRNSAI